MLVHLRVTPSTKFICTHLYTWVDRGTVRVKCLAQEHNTINPARAQMQTAPSVVKCTNHEATEFNNHMSLHWSLREKFVFFPVILRLPQMNIYSQGKET